jgi:hypothetical protein
MSEQNELEQARRMVAYLQAELDRQRGVNAEMRRAVADMARAFQESLARAYDAAESGDIAQVRRVVIENRAAWQDYLQQIVQAASTPARPSASPDEPAGTQ